MRKYFALVLTLACVLGLIGCAKNDPAESAVFQATILEINNQTLLVEPVEGSQELKSSDQIKLPLKNMSISPVPKVGDIIEITYNGEIAECYPAEINEVYNVEVVEVAETITFHDKTVNKADLGDSVLEGSLLALESEGEVQAPAEQVENVPAKPAEPPAEEEIPIKIYEPTDVEFSGQTLTAYLDTMTYQERLAWIETETEYTGGTNPISSGEYLEGQECIAYIELWPGRGYFDENLVIRFADGTQASLLLPRENGYADALPDSMKFQEGKFIYEITFPTEEVTNEGQTLIHLKGTYHYEVDLTAKTLSLTVLQ